MITLTKGNILLSKAEALVNTVNTEGVMGKGIALQFKESFNENYKLYRQACDKGEVRVGKMFVTQNFNMDGAKYIINFPTKKHWRYPSKLEYVMDGLDDLKNVIRDYNIKSIAMPPLGCGNGGLEWSVVKELIYSKLGDLEEVDVQLFEPSVLAYATKRDVSQRKQINLTDVRALVLSVMNQYSLLGYTLSLLETQKLVYFLERLGEPLQLNYSKSNYGPFASKLNHVLLNMEGFYLIGMKYLDIKRYDPLEVIQDKKRLVDQYIEAFCTDEQKSRLSTVYSLIEGFEFPLGMELLSTVDYVMKYETIDRENLQEVQERVSNWNDRKKQLLTPEYVRIAHSRLTEYSNVLY